MAGAKWIVLNKKADFQAMVDALGIDPLTARLLANRGADTVEKAEQFLHGGLSELHDPARLKDAERLTELLSAALGRGEKVAVAADYDADGIFSGMILKEALERIGAEVSVYTPDRISEGYGLNRRITDEAHACGAGVLLTCDNGIAAHEAVAYAKSLGMTVLVTDHHEEPETGLPPADAVVDPKQEGDTYPFPGICGAFVAYKVMCLLYRRLGRKEEELHDLIPYAAIATVTDVCDLTDENRILLREGLKMMGEMDAPGLRAMLSVCGLEGRPLSAYHLGFVLGPCFNAAGRLETVETVQKLFAAPDLEAALPLAKKLQDLNELRKSLTEEGRRAASEAISREGLDRDRILVIYLPDVHESVAGIIAGRLREAWSRPVLVITGKGETVKGSGRSTESYDLFEGLEDCRELLDKYGGHAMAAGFSLKKCNIAALRDKINSNSCLTDEDLCPIIKLDAVMRPEYATMERIREWDSLAPFGKANDRPLFGQSGVTVTEVRVLGQNRNALRMRFRAEGGPICEGIWFGDADAFLEELKRKFGEKQVTALERGQKGVKMALAYQAMIHSWNGRSTIQFQILHYQA